MRVLVISQYFYPEEFKINDLVEELVARGHEVTVLTGKPNYPKGEYYSGYKFLGKNIESYKGATVIRVPLIKRGRAGSINLIFNYLSYVIYAGMYVLSHKMTFNSIFCFETSPITQAFPAIWAKKKSKAKLSMWVQDLWPESVAAASNIKNTFVIKLIDLMVKRIYDKCDILLVQSNAFSTSILEKGDFREKIVYAPNWAEDIFVDTAQIDINKYKDRIPNGFIVMFAGNIGEAQDLDSIIKAAAITSKNSDIHWVIVGDGRYRNKAQELVIEKGLKDTVHFLGRFPVSDMPSFFCHADAMLLTLKDEYIFSLTIPSKTQAYMAFGKPILTMINGIANDVVKESGCGLVAEAGDYLQLASNVNSLYESSKSSRIEMGRSGQSYYLKNFSKSQVINVIENYL